MSSSNTRQTRRRPNRWRRILLDILLLPPALLYVVIENIFWFAATVLLREAAKLPLVGALQERIKKLPAAAVIPLFLIPEIFSHLGGLWATVLLVHRKFALGLIVGIFIKGIATLLTVWIYQSCAPALLSVKWFAWGHDKAFQARDWVIARFKPAREFARRLITSSRSYVRGRFRMLRNRLAHGMGLPKK